MRFEIAAVPAALVALATTAFAQNISVNGVNSVDQATKSGELSWGADNLFWGYSAGVGLNFNSTLLGGGFNAGIPGSNNSWQGSLGGGWTVTKDSLTFGFGGVIAANKTVDVAIFGDFKTGNVTVTVNGVPVQLEY